jgi:Leucine-rich repeat (LRR) protein
MHNPPPKSRRRWLRFSLRTLLVFVLVLSVPLGWFAWRLDKARRQREVVEAILKAGGSVVYDYQLDKDGRPNGGEPMTPAWLRKSLGDDFFREVMWVNFHLTQVTDAGLEYIKGLNNLEELDLGNTQVTDAGLEHFKGLNSLEGLWLDNTQVTDAGLKHLKGMTNLRELYLNDTQVTDESVEKLRDALPDCKIEH